MAFRALRDGATADAATWTADAAHAVFTATPGLAERMTFAFVLQVLGAQLVGMVAGEIPMHEAGEDGLHN